MHTANFYPNFAPMQELDDWFSTGRPGRQAALPVRVQLAALVGLHHVPRLVPRQADVRQARSPGSSAWRSGTRSSSATRLSGSAKRRRNTCAGRAGSSARGAVWHRWDYPRRSGRRRPRNSIRSWRCTSRTTGARSAPGASRRSTRWEHDSLLETARRALTSAARSSRLTGTASSGPASARTTLTRDSGDGDGLRAVRLDANAGGKALIRNNMPLLAYIGGKPEAFTSKDHNFFPGETVDKQLIVINNSRAHGDVRLRLVGGPARRAAPAQARATWRPASRSAFR